MASTGSSSSGAAPERAPQERPIVAGLPAYQNGGTIGQVIAALREGLSRDFAGLGSRIVLVDCGSTDGTVERAREAIGRSADLVELALPAALLHLPDVPYHGIPGKARALQMILTTAQDLNACACVIFDSRVTTVTPDWLDRLARPVVEHGFDLVSPHYARRTLEGTLTKGIVYPLVRALYGVPLRQPAAAEFACSARLVDHVLDEEIWEREGAQVGIDLWLATAAASGDFRIGEAELGSRAQQARAEAALDLPTTIAQVVGSLFADMEGRASRWQRTRGCVGVPRFGTASAVAPAEDSDLDLERLIQSYRFGYRELRDIWTWVLPPRTIVGLSRLEAAPIAQFRLDDELWARVVYDFAMGYRLRVLPRDHLLRSLAPLYSGWLASFALETRQSTLEEADARVERLASVFEAQKGYLISRWRWPERLRTA